MKSTKEKVLKEASSSKSNKVKVESKTKSKKGKVSFLEKLFKKDNKKNIKQKNNKSKGKGKKTIKENSKYVNGKFNLDIWEILIIVVATALVSCVFTGFILNYQFRKNINYIDTELIADDNVQEFLEIYSEIVDNFYEEVDEDAMIGAALDGMLKFLEDNYSIFLNKNDSDSLSESLDGAYEGIGIVAIGNVVYQVYDGSPAAEAGLLSEDEIIEINGTVITVENYELITELLDKDGENTIVVKRGSETLTFKVEVAKVNIPSVYSNVITSEDKKQKIGYLQLSSFSAHSYEDVVDALLELEEEEKIDSLIIDLRDNTGGYLTAATDISSLFLEKGKLIYSLESKDETTEYKDETKDKREYKIVVLVNSNTASAAEILASALHDSYGATIVGKTTFGKGKVQTMKYYEDTIVKYTSAKWLRPNGECVDEVGIIPDYEVNLEYGENVIYDRQLDKAIELLS